MGVPDWIYMYTGVHVGLQLWATMWELRIEPDCSVRDASSFNPIAISSVSRTVNIWTGVSRKGITGDDLMVFKIMQCKNRNEKKLGFNQ